jgi:uncharacterized protein YraI
MSYNKLVVGVVVVVMMVMSLAIAVDAQDGVVFVPFGETNVRSGPSTAYMLRGHGAEPLQVTGWNGVSPDAFCGAASLRQEGKNTWLRVDFAGIEGWVAACLGTEVGDLASLPIVGPGNGLMKPVNADYLEYSWVREPASPFLTGYLRAVVNVREAGSLEADVIGQAAPNTVYVIARNHDASWLQVMYGETTGWVAGHLVRLPVDADITLGSLPIK